MPTYSRALDLSPLYTLDSRNPYSSGQFSDVWKLDRNDGNTLHAKLIVKIPRGSNTRLVVDNTNKKLRRRAEIWITLKHPNVAEFMGLWTFEGSPFTGIVLPFYAQGNVREYVKSKQSGNLLSFRSKMMMILEVAHGLCYLHDMKVVHGDLRADNVMVDSCEHAVIMDYQMVSVIDTSQFTTNKVAATARWTAPEILNPPEELLTADADALMNEKTDIFAFGMTCMEILTGERPFANIKNDSSTIFAIIKGNRPYIGPDFQNFVPYMPYILNSCWHEDPDKRPDAAQICQVLQINGSFKQKRSFLRHWAPVLGISSAAMFVSWLWMMINRR